MMSLTKISSKNQITLPVAMMNELDLFKGQNIWMEIEKRKIVIKAAKKDIIDEIAGSLTKYVDPNLLGLSDKEIMQKTKKIVLNRMMNK